jgi:hypothetical protein
MNLHRKAEQDFTGPFFYHIAMHCELATTNDETASRQAGSQHALSHDPLHPHWHLSEVMDRLLGLPFLGFQPDTCISPQICSAFLFYLLPRVTAKNNAPLSKLKIVPLSACPKAKEICS